MPEERDQRIMDLATGFALGELDDAELHEFYDLLREPGADGAHAGEVAWEALGICIDLRSQLGSTFQDALFLGLSESGEAETARFAAKVRNRLGHSRPKLQPVTAASSVSRRRLAVPVSVALGSLLTVLALLFWFPRAETAVATVSSVVGSVVREGRSLNAGDALDRQQIVVGDGGQLGLSWQNHSIAIIAGPASVVVGREGFALLAGRAWCHAQGTMTLGLPDRSEGLALEPGVRCAIDIHDNRSTIGVLSGRIHSGLLQLATNQAVEVLHPTYAYSWRDEPILRDTPAEPGSSQARWTVVGTVVFQGTESAVVVHVRLDDDHAAELVLTPGGAALRVDGREIQRLALSGAPLAERDLRLSGQGDRMSLALGGQRMDVPLPAAPQRISWNGQHGELRDARLGTGPAREPPFPLAQPW